MSPTDVERGTAAAPSASSGSPTTLMNLVVFVFMWIGWILFLAGTAAGQAACVDSGSGTFVGRKLLVSVSQACSTNYSLPWWIVWLQFFCIVAAMVLAFKTDFRAQFTTFVLLLFAIETTLLMSHSGDLNTAIVISDIGNNKQRDADRCALAGTVILMLANLAYLLLASSNMAVLSASYMQRFNTPIGNSGTDNANANGTAGALHATPAGSPVKEEKHEVKKDNEDKPSTPSSPGNSKSLPAVNTV